MRIVKKIMIAVSYLSIASCANWLDLKPENQATGDLIFGAGDGYRSALNGIYKNMGERNLYGVELQFGIVDCMSRQYTLTKNSGGNGGVEEKYVAAREFDFQNNTIITPIETIWKAGFNVIANANNIIQNIKDEPESKFSKGEMERSLIMGEAYACRALMHFDLLRLFAPAIVNDDNRNYVPYVDKYPNIQADGIPVKEFINKVIADLKLALELTRDFDMSTFGQGGSSSGNARFKNDFDYGWGNDDLPGYQEDFFKGRGYRLSYYAITALLARVYQYAGMRDEAFEAAKTVLEFKAVAYDNSSHDMFSREDFGGFQWETNPEYYRDLKATASLIFGVHNGKAYDSNSLGSFFMKRTDGMNAGNWLTFDLSGQKIFVNSANIDENATDIRSTKLVFMADNWKPISGKWYPSDDKKLRDDNLTIMPIIRATEMRYIMAEEYALRGQFTEAYDIINKIRQNRGLETPLETKGTYSDFEIDLVGDARREWMSEGQLLYLYKRLNFKVDLGNGITRPLLRGESMLPIPLNQTL